MRAILLILSFVLLTSCGSYKVQQRGPEITHILAITKEGDTLKVPVEDLQRKLTPDYYDGYRFYWNNSWWMYNDWYWNYWYQNPRWFYPRYQIRIPQNRVRVQTPRYTPNRVVVPQRRGTTPQIQPNRGRSNTQQRTQVRQPNYNRSTPPPTNSNRNSVVRRTTNGERIIKQ